jgi:hypothetical protein
VTLEVVAQDGLRVRAAAKAASFRRRAKLQHYHELAQAQVEALKDELEADAAASQRRKQAARERAAREREARLAQALANMAELEQRQAPKSKPAASQDQGDPPSPPAAKRPSEPRASTTDPEARVMKMADGGFRPAFNAQLAVDRDTQLIAAVALTNAGSDMGQMAPLHAQILERYGCTPEHWLADGGFAQLEAIETLSMRGTQAVVPPPAARRADIDPAVPKRGDSPAIAQWRKFMATPEAQALYLERGATVECANAHLRRRGLQSFTLRGLLKARAVLLWHALAHNLMRMRALNFAFAA